MVRGENGTKVSLVAVLSLMVALSGVLSGVAMHMSDNRVQTELKKYEVTFTGRQESYKSFMRYLTDSFHSAVNRDKEKLGENLYYLESAYFGMEPFIDDIETRRFAMTEIQRFAEFCSKGIEVELSEKDKLKKKDIFINYRHKFRQRLYSELFGELLADDV